MNFTFSTSGQYFLDHWSLLFCNQKKNSLTTCQILFLDQWSVFSWPLVSDPWPLTGGSMGIIIGQTSLFDKQCRQFFLAFNWFILTISHNYICITFIIINVVTVNFFLSFFLNFFLHFYSFKQVIIFCYNNLIIILICYWKLCIPNI